MARGIIAKKVGMTRLFFEDGRQDEGSFDFTSTPDTSRYDEPGLVTVPNPPQSPDADFTINLGTGIDMFANTQMMGLDTGFPDLG